MKLTLWGEEKGKAHSHTIYILSGCSSSNLRPSVPPAKTLFSATHKQSTRVFAPPPRTRHAEDFWLRLKVQLLVLRSPEGRRGRRRSRKGGGSDWTERRREVGSFPQCPAAANAAADGCCGKVLPFAAARARGSVRGPAPHASEALHRPARLRQLELASSLRLPREFLPGGSLSVQHRNEPSFGSRRGERGCGRQQHGLPGSRRWRGPQECSRWTVRPGGAWRSRAEGRILGREAEEFNLQEAGVLQVGEEGERGSSFSGLAGTPARQAPLLHPRDVSVTESSPAERW